MCSHTSLPSRNCTIATSGISTERPLGGMPGSIQSISRVWVKQNRIVHEAVCPYGAADRDQPRVVRVRADEMVRVEALELILVDAARHDRDVVDVRVVH